MSLETILLSLENKVAHLQTQKAHELTFARTKGANAAELAQIKGARAGMGTVLDEISSMLKIFI